MYIGRREEFDLCFYVIQGKKFMRRRIIIEKGLLEALYWGNQYTQQEIADMFGVGGKVISERMKKYNIPTRHNREIFIEKEILKSLHWGNQCNIYRIANIFHTGMDTIYRRMERYSIPTTHYPHQRYSRGFYNKI